MALVDKKNIYLDFCVKDLVVINCTQYDKNSRTFFIHILDKGKPYTMNGTTCQLAVKMEKKDGTLILNDCPISSDGATATLLLTEQMCIFDGLYDIQFMYINRSTDEIIHTMPARINIAKSVADNVKIASSNEFDVLNKFLVSVDNILDEINTNENTRKVNELSRVSAENTRISNENVRISNENTRISNENTRIGNETTRNTEFAQIKTDTSKAISDAETATNNANASSQRAEAATDAINELINNNTILFRTEKGAANGVAELDANGKVPSSQLPSYVDDVLEYNKMSDFPATGESGKIYIDLSTNKTYRWGGSQYVEISASIVIGTTTGTALDGKIGSDHIANTLNPHQVTKEQLGLGNVENKSSSDIRSEITNTDISDALGYTPYNASIATASSDGLMPKEDKSWVNQIKDNLTKDNGNVKINVSDGKLYYNNNEVATVNEIPTVITGYMMYKGTLGIDGTITQLPNPSLDNKGHTYSVITEGDYSYRYGEYLYSIHLKVGNIVVSNAPDWDVIETGSGGIDIDTATVTETKQYLGIDGFTPTGGTVFMSTTSKITSMSNTDLDVHKIKEVTE